mmetsp:Transcript_24980/g.62347  ORF Transcript_24980/g.62347 Transcript_24980/m.62347 type:complete len:209 (+) Transcript_24980:1882-2508(+)
MLPFSNEPMRRPFHSEPMACAASSITIGRKPKRSKQNCCTSLIASKSTGVPPQWTNCITLVVGLSLYLRSWMLMLPVFVSTSTHLGLRPRARMGQLVAVQVSAVVRTSSPTLSPGHAPEGLKSMCSARCSAEVAELRVSTYGFCRYELSFSSNSATRGPCVMYPLFRVLLVCSAASAATYTLNSGTSGRGSANSILFKNSTFFYIIRH